MKTFLTYILEGQQQFNKTVALVGGSFKPPTVAHWYMVEQYAKKADEVVILISDPKNPKSIRKTSTGTIITAEMSKSIFDIYINKYGLQGKVKAIISPEPSPITALFKYIDGNLNDVNVIMGVSKKGGDEARFKSAEKYYVENEHIHLLDPIKTAVDPYVNKDGMPISATDARNSLDNPETVKKYLPAKLSLDDIDKIMSILKVKPTSESYEQSKESLKPLDETEDINLIVNDDLLNHSKIFAYNVGQSIPNDKGKEVPINPKKFPTKAVDVIFPVGELLVEVYLDTKNKKWDSRCFIDGHKCKLSPDQMGLFFNTEFYNKLQNKLSKEWPLSDEFYGTLFEGISNKQMLIVDDEDQNLSEDEDKPEPRLNVIKKDEEKDKPTHTKGGRKIMNFSDTGVKTSSAEFMCWPKKGSEFRWSQWADYKKIRLLCKCRFEYSNDHVYSISLPVVDDKYNHRGFRVCDITEKPPVQWLTKEESEDVMKLSIVDKFVKVCAKRILKYLDMDPEEIMKKINNPEKLTIEDIKRTQSMIRKTLNEIVKNKLTEDYIWS